MLDSLREYKVISDSFDEYLKEKGIRVEKELFSSDPINPLVEILEGNLDIYQVPTSQLYTITGKEWLKVWEQPFLFADKEHVERYINSEHSKKRVQELEIEGLKPLTYSYAGGFCYVAKEKGTPIRYDMLLQPTNNINDLGDDDNKDVLSREIWFPHAFLAYEAAGYTKVSEYTKKEMEIVLSNHIVQSRITFISKRVQELGDEVVKYLHGLLEQERMTVYRKAEEATKILLSDGNINTVGVTEQELEIQRINQKKNKPELEVEINLVRSL